MKRNSDKSAAIGLFNDSFPPIIDGVTLTVQNYARNLSEKGNPIKVVTPWNPHIIHTDYEVIRYFSLPIRGRAPYRYGYPKLDPFIWRKLRNTPFRLIHCHCPFSSGRLGVYAAHKQNVPLIGTFHSKYKSDLQHSFKHLPIGIEIIMKRILDFFNQCDEVWIPQAKVEETVREYGYRGKLRVMENGSDFITELGEIPEKKIRARKKLGIPENTLSLLFVGQHIREKGVMLIIEALHLLAPGLDFHMNFIGEGYAEEDMKQKVKGYGLEDKVSFNGIITDREKLSTYYAASDLFLFPSLYDNAPLVVREAASFGTPAVLVEDSTASEVIRDRDNGFLSGHSAHEFADTIRTLESDRELIKKAGISARTSFVRDWKEIVEEVSDNYERIIHDFRR